MRIYPRDISLEEGDLPLLLGEEDELGETDAELEQIYRELAATIASGRLLRGSSVWDFDDTGDLAGDIV